jgi:D-glycero-alpha-D-manno-heptose-7-phosphate kinase
MFFFTSFVRNASEIAGEQIKKIVDKKKELKVMTEMTNEAINILNDKQDNFNDFGKLLHETWKIKRSLTSLVSTSEIDDLYYAALSAGAIGGKLCGAGGGGFMLFFAPPEVQPEIREKLNKLLYVPIRFEKLGSHVVLYSTQDV